MNIRNVVGAGHELRDVAHRGHAVGTHIGADIDIDVAAQADDQAVPVERHLDLAFGLARMRDRHEMLAPILHPFDRAAELARRKGDQKVFRIKFAPRPEAAADIEFNIIDRFLGKPDHARHGAAIEERQLGGARHAQAPGRAIPLGQQSARLHRHGGEPLRAKRFTAPMGRGAECRRDVALAGRDERCAIGAGALEQENVALGGGVPIRHRGQVLDVERNGRDGILGKLGAVGQDHGDGLAHIAHHGRRDDGLRIGSNRRIGPPKRNRRDRMRQVLRRHDGPDPRHSQSRRRVDRADTTVGDRAAHDRGVPLAFARQVIDILAAAAQEAQILETLDRAADECIRALFRCWLAGLAGP